LSLAKHSHAHTIRLRLPCLLARVECGELLSKISQRPQIRALQKCRREEVYAVGPNTRRHVPNQVSHSRQRTSRRSRTGWASGLNRALAEVSNVGASKGQNSPSNMSPLDIRPHKGRIRNTAARRPYESILKSVQKEIKSSTVRLATQSFGSLLLSSQPARVSQFSTDLRD
jgi:hypothetical protein